MLARRCGILLASLANIILAELVILLLTGDYRELTGLWGLLLTGLMFTCHMEWLYGMLAGMTRI